MDPNIDKDQWMGCLDKEATEQFLDWTEMYCKEVPWKNLTIETQQPDQRNCAKTVFFKVLHQHTKRIQKVIDIDFRINDVHPVMSAAFLSNITQYHIRIQIRSILQTRPREDSKLTSED